MIIEYSCNNFRSIGDEIRFSMVAGQDKFLENNFYNVNELNVLKEATIYGANGSGKSNFIKSLILLKKLVINSTKLQPGDLMLIDPNKTLFDRNCEFQIHFISNNIRFLYGLGYNANGVSDEFLYYYPNNRVAKIFDRENGVITYGEAFKKSLSGVERDFLKPNQLMLSAAALYRNIDEIKSAFLFFNKDLVVYTAENDWDMYSASAASNPELKSRFVDFMKRVGNRQIIDIDSKVEESIVDASKLPPILRPDIQFMFEGSTARSINVKFQYPSYELDLSEESLGNQKLFALFFQFMDIILNNKVLLCDELETHLHPLIVKELLTIFKENARGAQLIFSTHDANLLDLSMFRRDQIWFTEQKDNGFTDLYSLAELKSVRKDENVTKNYLLGKYSGIPVINKDIKNSLLGESTNE